MLAIIGGTVIFSLPLLKDKRAEMLCTKYGKAFFYSFDNLIILNRHGVDKNIPPHCIDYAANLGAIKSLGVKKVIALNSCGSLKKEIKPGTFIVPDDYLNFDTITIFGNKIKHITPMFDKMLIKTCIQALKELNLSFRNKGIYAQTRGPRFETRAEVNLLRDYADIVGMTLAKEATIARELGLKYASICSIDNYANGVASRALSYKLIKENAKKNLPLWEKIINKIAILEDSIFTRS